MIAGHSHCRRRICHAFSNSSKENVSKRGRDIFILLKKKRKKVNMACFQFKILSFPRLCFHHHPSSSHQLIITTHKSKTNPKDKHIPPGRSKVTSSGWASRVVRTNTLSYFKPFNYFSTWIWYVNHFCLSSQTDENIPPEWFETAVFNGSVTPITQTIYTAATLSLSPIRYTVNQHDLQI